jgi:putative redox protein
MIRASSLPDRYRTAFANGAHEGVADVPVEKGGAGLGFGPHELLEAALATCIVMTVEMFAAKHEIPIRGARCEVRIDRSVPDAVTLRYSLTLEGALTEEQAALLRQAASACPVSRTLTGKIALQPYAAE